jgi:hypothetical protein
MELTTLFTRREENLDAMACTNFQISGQTGHQTAEGADCKTRSCSASPYSEIQFVVCILSSLLCFLHLQMLVSGNAHDQANARKTITVVAKFVVKC